MSITGNRLVKEILTRPRCVTILITRWPSSRLLFLQFPEEGARRVCFSELAEELEQRKNATGDEPAAASPEGSVIYVENALVKDTLKDKRTLFELMKMVSQPSPARLVLVLPAVPEHTPQAVLSSLDILLNFFRGHKMIRTKVYDNIYEGQYLLVAKKETDVLFRRMAVNCETQMTDAVFPPDAGERYPAFLVLDTYQTRTLASDEISAPNVEEISCEELIALAKRGPSESYIFNPRPLRVNDIDMLRFHRDLWDAVSVVLRSIARQSRRRILLSGYRLESIRDFLKPLCRESFHYQQIICRDRYKITLTRSKNGRYLRSMRIWHQLLLRTSSDDLDKIFSREGHPFVQWSYEGPVSSAVVPEKTGPSGAAVYTLHVPSGIDPEGFDSLRAKIQANLGESVHGRIFLAEEEHRKDFCTLSCSTWGDFHYPMEA